MSKSVISKTSEIANLRKKMRRSNVVQAILLAFLLICLYVIYVFLSVASKGYNGKEPLFTFNQDWLKNIFVYFDTTESLFNFNDIFKNSSIMFRWITIVCVVLLSVFLGIFYGVLHGKSCEKKYKNKYQKALIEEVKINGLSMDILKSNPDENNTKSALTRANISKPNASEIISFSSPSISWNGIQYNYTYNDKKRNGYLIQTTLPRSRTEGLIQFRTFGRPSMNEYESNEIRKYGFAENPKMGEYVCYTTLGQGIYAVIDSTVVDALYNFKQYVGCGIIVTLAGSSLSIFIDGFKMVLTKGLKEKIPSDDFIERQAAAIAALHKCVSAIANSFTADQFVMQFDDQSLA